MFKLGDKVIVRGHCPCIVKRTTKGFYNHSGRTGRIVEIDNTMPLPYCVKYDVTHDLHGKEYNIHLQQGGIFHRDVCLALYIPSFSYNRYSISRRANLVSIISY